MLRADGERLIVYHFHALSKIGRWVFAPGLKMYGAKANRLIRRSIYGPYLKVLNAKMPTANEVLGTSGEISDSRYGAHSGANPDIGRTILERIRYKKRLVVKMMRGVANWRYLLNIPDFGTW